MFLELLSPVQWGLCLCAALCIGLSKSGFPGVSLVTVAIMAQAFPARASTGVLLPLLIFGDVCAVGAFRQHAVWPQIVRMLGPTMVGVGVGFEVMRRLPESRFPVVLGWMLLVTVGLQAWRMAVPDAGSRVPHSRGFAWLMGVWAGVATMVANAAGPVMAIYFLALALPKQNLVGTSAWFFLLINVFKLPFSWWLGLLQPSSVRVDLLLFPVIGIGILLGRRILHWIPQRLFEALLLLSAAAAAFKMALFSRS
jgi:uncharacterized membrane protein YfcA